MSAPSAAYAAAYEFGLFYIEQGVEQRSAFKQGGNDCGIEFGSAMGEFVTWAEARYYN